jgi:hypothetical protein
MPAGGGRAIYEGTTRIVGHPLPLPPIVMTDLGLQKSTMLVALSMVLHRMVIGGGIPPRRVGLASTLKYFSPPDIIKTQIPEIGVSVHFSCQEAD